MPSLRLLNAIELNSTEVGREAAKTHLTEDKDEVLEGQHVCSLRVLDDHHKRPP